MLWSCDEAIYIWGKLCTVSDISILGEGGNVNYEKKTSSNQMGGSTKTSILFSNVN